MAKPPWQISYGPRLAKNSQHNIDTARRRATLLGPHGEALLTVSAQAPTMRRMTITRTLLFASLTLALATTADAAIEVRKGGSSWAKIEDDGTIRIGGSSVGKIERDGTVRKSGSSVGRIESDGTIRDGGSSVGRVENDGTVRYKGSSVGRIESGGTLRKGGSSWGSASSCCGDFGSKRSIAGLLYFFSDFF